jgi:hypothetical protein
MKSYVILLFLVSLLLLGCNTEPAIHSLSGKVTLGGKAYERLIVYLHPIDGPVTRHNTGIGETDAKGMMKLVTSAGDGIAAGKYRVSFSCYQAAGGQAIDSRTEKLSEVGGRKDGNAKEPVNLVPAPYNSSTVSPVEITVESGSNTFDFDVPLK